MHIGNVARGHNKVIVTVENIAPDRQVSDDLLKGYAMHAAGENPSSLFGTNVCRFTDNGITVAASVTLFTD